MVCNGTSRLVRPVWPQSDLRDRRLWTADEAVCGFQRVGSLLQDWLATFQRLRQDLLLGLHRFPNGGDGRREGLKDYTFRNCEIFLLNFSTNKNQIPLSPQLILKEQHIATIGIKMTSHPCQHYLRTDYGIRMTSHLIIRSWHPGRQLGTFCNEWRLFPTWRHLEVEY